MLDQVQSRLDAGVFNLLFKCAGCEAGQRVLFVHETEMDGYYNPQLVHDIAASASRMGLYAQLYGVPLQRDAVDPDPELCAKMSAVDCTVFLARLGDQIRFRPQNAAMNQIISYALDHEMYASPFGTIDYRAFDRLKSLLNTAVAAAEKVHVTCPLGTDLTGGRVVFPTTGSDTCRKRFPLSVSAPIPADTFEGKIAQTGFLTGTGSNYYTPYSCALDDTLFVHFKANAITRFEGTDADVTAATRHYEFVGSTYGIDTYHVHSWHAGIHPGCQYGAFAGDNMERWGGVTLGNPRLLHFHTCGASPPGEISLNVLDPTVRLDGVAVWENGRLYPDRVAGGAELLTAFPDMAAAFENPAQSVGLASDGRLRLR